MDLRPRDLAHAAADVQAVETVVPRLARAFHECRTEAEVGSLEVVVRILAATSKGASDELPRPRCDRMNEALALPPSERDERWAGKLAALAPRDRLALARQELASILVVGGVPARQERLARLLLIAPDRVEAADLDRVEALIRSTLRELGLLGTRGPKPPEPEATDLDRAVVAHQVRVGLSRADRHTLLAAVRCLREPGRATRFTRSLTPILAAWAALEAKFRRWIRREHRFASTYLVVDNPRDPRPEASDAVFYNAERDERLDGIERRRGKLAGLLRVLPESLGDALDRASSVK